MKTPAGESDGCAATRKRGREDDGEDASAEDRRVHGEGSVERRIQEDALSKRKWTRLLLRELYDLGFDRAAACLEEEADVRVRSQAMETLQRLVVQHKWDDALRFLQSESGPAEVLHMKSRAAAKEVALLLLKRKYVELLLQKQLKAALETFQQQILPTYELSEEETQELAVLLLCGDQPQMEQLVHMPLKDAELLGRIEALVSPDEVVPHGCLRQMVHWNDGNEKPVVSFAQAERVNAECIALLLNHTHEVLDVAFSPDGNYLASVSRDATIIVWKLEITEMEDENTGDSVLTLTPKALHVLQCLDGTPDSIAWSPDSHSLLSAGGDDCSIIQLWNPLTGRRVRRFQHPAESVSCVQWLPDGRHFLSGSVDKSMILWDSEDDSNVAYQWGGRRAIDMAVHPKGDHVFVLTSETELRVYNLADKSDSLLLRAEHLMSGISMAPSGDYLLLSFIEHEELACFSVASDTIVSRQRGFKQERYVLRSCFAGQDNELVVCGSEDGALHVWRREDGKQLSVTNDHSSVVNAVAAHPVHPQFVASASDDETIRLWRLRV